MSSQIPNPEYNKNKVTIEKQIGNTYIGTNSKGHITTIHTQTGKDFWRTINGNAQDKVIRVVK